MPSKSKQQQKFFGVVKSMQKGDIPNKGEAGDVADDMDKKEVDKMTSTKHKGLPKKIKEMVLQELVKELKLNEVKPFVDPKLKTKPTDPVQYIATNDHRYPSEIAFFDTKKNEVVFFNIQRKEVERVSVDRLNSTHWVRDYMPGLKYNQGLRTGAMEGKVNEADRTSSISKQRAKAELKQQLKGKRADGLGDYTAIVYGMDGNDRVALKSMNDINNYSKFEIGDNEHALKEGLARGLKPLLMIGSTIKKNVGEDTLVDLSDKFDELDDEDADNIASHLNMAIEVMQDGYAGDATKSLKQFNKACKDALSGKPIKSAFENVNEGQLTEASATALKSKYETAIKKEQQLSSLMLANLEKYKAAKAKGDEKAIAKFTKIAGQLSPKKKVASENANAAYQAYEDAISGLHADAELELKESKLNEEDYKYKKYVSKAFDKISDAMFDFRHAMGIKQLTNKDMKLKKKFEALQAGIFALRREMKSKGLTEGMLNEMDINDPVLIAVRARATMIKKNKDEWKGFKKLSLDQYWKKLEYRSFLETQMKDAAKELEQLDSEMNQDAGQKGEDWTDADANSYGGDLDKLQTKIEKLAKLKLKVNKSIMHYRTH